VAALKDLEVDAVPTVWDDPIVDWAAFDLVVLRSTWDYAEHRDEFLSWAEQMPRLANPVEVVRWNTDKARYFRDLAAAGVPLVTTRFLEPGESVELPLPPLAVKPAVSAGGRSSGRFEAGEEQVARELVARIHAEGRTAMAQPYLRDADAGGETALVYIAGRYSHAAARHVPLPRSGATRRELYLAETVEPREASAEERAVADRAIAAVPGSEELLYGRVDLLHADDGSPLVLELEVTEPSLYLSLGDGAAERLAAAIAGALG
jgi:glutathione synthase/RimK-type ligase-like ATP-grasp enzyme